MRNKKTFAELEFRDAFLFAATMEDEELCRYTYEYQCQESGEPLDDGICRIFLNTKGKNRQDVPAELISFLQFVEDSGYVSEAPDDELLQGLYGRIRYLKRNRRMEERYMLFGELLDEERKLGQAEGLEQGRMRERATLLSLVAAMTADGNEKELARLESEPEFLEEMLEFYKPKM